MIKFFSRLAICVTAILVIALCGCDDLGAYADVKDYFDSFDDIVLIDGVTKGTETYSVSEYFYNEESRENFLVGEDGVYNGLPHANYVYVAIPFANDIDMDSLALYMQSQNDVTVYISVFVTDKIPSKWQAIADSTTNAEDSESDSDSSSDEEEGPTYDDPDPTTRVGEVSVHLQKGKWSSFLIDYFKVNGSTRKSIEINEGQYILLQIRNNSGVRVFDEEKQTFVDQMTGLELQKAEITMTNLLVRALKVESGDESHGGE